MQTALKTGVVSLETITPDRARKLIERNERNRKLSLNLVRDYARSMIEGRWRPNGETVKVGRDGALLDGQHRLHACISANVSFATYVAYDIDGDTFDTIDIGRKRTGGDILQIEGCKNAVVTSAMMRWIDCIQGNTSVANIRIPPDEARLRWVSDPLLEESASQSNHCKKILAPSIGAALHYLFSRLDRDAADRFLIDLGSGAGLEDSDSVYVLRERLLAERIGKTKILPEEKAALAIRAWNHRRERKPTKTLKGMILDSEGTRSYPRIK